MLTQRSLVLAFLLAGLALLWWPSGQRAWHREGQRSGGRGAGAAFRSPRVGSVNLPPVVVALGIAVAVTILGSIAKGLAAGIVVGTTLALLRTGSRRSEAARTRIETVDAVRVLARELRSGAPVPVACEAAVGAAGHRAAPLISALGVAAKVGSDTLLVGANRYEIEGVGRSLGAAWTLSRRHGIPLAGLVEGAAEELSRTAAAVGRQDALLAGPRLSGYLLSALPVLGIGLGLGMGANPLPILFGDGIGSILLVVGTTLTCAGLLWSARIAR